MKKYRVEVGFGENFDAVAEFQAEMPEVEAESALEAAGFSEHWLDKNALFKVYELKLNEFGTLDIDWNTEERFIGYTDFI